MPGRHRGSATAAEVGLQPRAQGTEQMMHALEMEPARRNAVAAGAVETAGGAMVAAGVATPLAPPG